MNKTVNVSEVKGVTLDWLVAKCNGLQIEVKNTDSNLVVRLTNHQDMFSSGARKWAFEPSIDWSQAGPIIAREHISLVSPSTLLTAFWQADTGFGNKFTQWDHDPLLAAMRCYVVSKLGEEVEVPGELA